MFVVPRTRPHRRLDDHARRPTAKQVKFFNTTLGGEPSAGITVFKPARSTCTATITGAEPGHAADATTWARPCSSRSSDRWRSRRASAWR